MKNLELSHYLIANGWLYVEHYELHLEQRDCQSGDNGMHYYMATPSYTVNSLRLIQYSWALSN